MKKQYKHIKVMTMGLFVAIGMVATLIAPAQSVRALDCGILPQSICKDADKAPTGGDVKTTATWGLLKLGVQIMTAGVAILAVGGLIYGSVLYISAGPNQEQVKKAKGMFLNVAIGIVAFALMFGLLQWLIPGGVF